MAEVISKRATYADVEAAPEHVIAEILDGELVTQPRPTARHNAAATNLLLKLGGPFQARNGGQGGWILFFETEVKFGENLLVPDISGWRVERFTGYPETNYFTIRPDFVCEVLSASTEGRDRTVKRRIYADAGVPYLWLLDPRQQVLESFELVNGEWTLKGTWRSDENVRAVPFDSISFRLADLWPLDKPLGFNESPQALYAGDR
jgi:Uma2 family endonuclease